MRKPNPVQHLSNGTSQMRLRRLSGPDLITVIDTSDYDLIKDMRWAAKETTPGRFYAYALVWKPDDSSRTSIHMHSVILAGVERIDHRDHDGLNNRRSNLRPATYVQNSWNTEKFKKNSSSQFKGVNWNAGKKRFEACISVHGKRIRLGYYDSEIEAAINRDSAAIKYHGEFAVLNFPISGPPADLCPISGSRNSPSRRSESE